MIYKKHKKIETLSFVWLFLCVIISSRLAKLLAIACRKTLSHQSISLRYQGPHSYGSKERPLLLQIEVFCRRNCPFGQLDPPQLNYPQSKPWRTPPSQLDLQNSSLTPIHMWNCWTKMKMQITSYEASASDFPQDFKVIVIFILFLFNFKILVNKTIFRPN